MDPFRPADIARLDEALHEDAQALAPFVKNAHERIKNAAGDNYGDKNNGDHRPVNLHALAVEVFAHRLMSADPRMLYSPTDSRWEEAALEREAAINEWSRRRRPGDALNEAVVHAIFAGMSIVQVGTCAYKTPYADPGEVCVLPIGLADWLHDMDANRWNEITRMSHEYRVPTAKLLDDPELPDEVKERIVESEKSLHTVTGEDRFSDLSQRENSRSGHEPHTNLRQIWLPLDNLVATYLSADQGGGMVIHGEPLRVVEWEGTDDPYLPLLFMPLPNNTIGLAPSARWEALDNAINEIANKVIRDANDYKQIGLYQLARQADAEVIRSTKHGHLAGVEDPEAVQEMTLGQPNPMLVNMLPQFRQLFSYLAGNLDQLGGLAAQTDTVGQEKLLAEGANHMMGALQRAVLSFTERVFRSIDFWLFSDPQLNLRATKRIPGTQLTVPFTMTKHHVRGTLEDYRIEVEPYSERFRTPQERLGQLLTLLQSVYFQLAPMMAQQGGNFDFDYLNKTIARLSGLPEIERFCQFFGPPPEGGAEGGMPSQTSRTYNRRDVGGGGMADQEAQMMQAMSQGMNGQAA